jgi:hypothetical protein
MQGQIQSNAKKPVPVCNKQTVPASPSLINVIQVDINANI